MVALFSQCNIKESAHTLTHNHAHFPPRLRSLALLTTLPFPLSFSHFSLCHAAHAHRKRLNKNDNRGWDCNFKVPPTVSAVYKRELLDTLLLPHSDWLGNLNKQGQGIASWASNSVRAKGSER